MLTVAIRTQRRIGDTAGNGLPVDAGFELVRDAGVAHAAGFRHSLPEFRRIGGLHLVRITVADRAIGRRCVALLLLTSMHATRERARLVYVTSLAGRFLDVLGVGILLVVAVAAFTAKREMNGPV